MTEIIFASFSNRVKADDAIDDLKEAGYSDEDISVMIKREAESTPTEKSVGADVAEGVGTGATAGGIIGGLVGFLAGAAGIIVVGPIAALLGLAGLAGTTITGLVVGAATGGLAGALSKLGLASSKAKSYEDTVQAGGAVIAVSAPSMDKDEVIDIFEANDAEDVTELAVEK